MQKLSKLIGFLCIASLILFLTFIPACEDDENDGDDNTPTPSSSPTPAVTPTPGGSTELSGTWVGSEINGAAGNWTFVFTGSTIAVVEPNPANAYGGNYTVDTTQNPKTVQVYIATHYNSSYVGRIMLGIYQLSGNSLTLAFNPPGHPFAPTNFDAVSPSRAWQLTKQ